MDPNCFPDHENEIENWINEEYPYDDIKKGTSEWDDAVDTYFCRIDEVNDYEEYISDLAEEKWLSENPQKVRFKKCIDDLDNLRNSLSESKKSLINKSLYSYSISIMEAFLGETAKALVFHDKKIMYRYLEKYGIEKSLSLIDIYDKPDYVKAKVIRQLSSVTFHNIKTIGELFGQLLDTKISLSELNKTITVRHDLVHRNGFTIEGDEVDHSRETIIDSINLIKKELTRLQEKIELLSLR